MVPTLSRNTIQVEWKNTQGTSSITGTWSDYLRMETAYPEIWRLDVVEWEQAGDAAETMGEVLQDSSRAWPNIAR